MSIEPATAWLCPKDVTAMAPIGHLTGAWRCPTCTGMVIDTEVMRHGNGGRPVWSGFVLKAFAGVVAFSMIRRLRRRSGKDTIA